MADRRRTPGWRSRDGAEALTAQSDWPALYIDTETAMFTQAAQGGDVPPVQIAAVLAMEDRVVGTLSFVLSRRLWLAVGPVQIEQRCVDIHGITEAMCDEFGVGPDVVLNQLRWMASKASVTVAHNIQFDVGIVDGSYRMQSLPPLAWPRQFCTMRESAGILRIPSGGRYAIGGFKAPKLSEAYRFFAKRDFSGAHDALADAYACRLVHRGILRHRAAEAAGSASGEAGGG